MAGLRDKTTPSEIFRAAHRGDGGHAPQTVDDRRARRAEFRVEKELDEARKAGTAAAMKVAK